MPGNENKSQVGSWTGGENERSGKVDIVAVSASERCSREQREGIFSISC